MTDTQSAQDTDAPDFAATLLNLAKGRTHQELSEQLAALVTAVRKTSKPGKLQLTLQVKPQKGNEALLVTAEVRATKPRFEPPASIFYATEEGALVRNDPNQQSLY